MTLNASQARVVDPILTERALGYSSTMQSWNLIAPPVTVPYRAGKIIRFGKERFRIYDSKRAPGADTAQVELGYESDPYALTQSRLKTKVPYEIQEESQLPNIDLRAESVDFVRENQERELEYEVASLLTASANYPSGHAPAIASGDKWDSATGKPIAQILSARNLIRRKIGRDPNTLFFSPNAWVAFQENADVKARIQYSERAIITEDITGQLVRLNIVVGKDIYANASGTTADIWGINGDNAILAYVYEPQAGGSRSNRQPSFAYTYVLNGNPFVEQGQYDLDTASWHDYVTYERAAYMTFPEAGYLFNAVTT